MKMNFRKKEVERIFSISVEQAEQIIGKENLPKAQKLADDQMPMLRHVIKKLRTELASDNQMLNEYLMAATDEKFFKESAAETLMTAAVTEAIQAYVRSGGKIDIKEQAEKELTPDLAKIAIEGYEDSIRNMMEQVSISLGFADLFSAIFK